MNSLEAVIDLCKKYVRDPKYVYTLHKNTYYIGASGYDIPDEDEDDRYMTDYYIVVMKKLPDVVTNEDRDMIVDARYATFQADAHGLQVVFIVDRHNINDCPNRLVDCDDTDMYYDFTEMYIVGETCNNTTQYYKTIERAYTSENAVPYDYTGEWRTWNYNGREFPCRTYVDGKLVDYKPDSSCGDNSDDSDNSYNSDNNDDY